MDEKVKKFVRYIENGIVQLMHCCDDSNDRLMKGLRICPFVMIYISKYMNKLIKTAKYNAPTVYR
jgi:hypothetical protein